MKTLLAVLLVGLHGFALAQSVPSVRTAPVMIAYTRSSPPADMSATSVTLAQRNQTLAEKTPIVTEKDLNRLSIPKSDPASVKLGRSSILLGHEEDYRQAPRNALILFKVSP